MALRRLLRSTEDFDSARMGLRKGGGNVRGGARAAEMLRVEVLAVENSAVGEGGEGSVDSAVAVVDDDVFCTGAGAAVVTVTTLAVVAAVSSDGRGLRGRGTRRWRQVCYLCERILLAQPIVQEKMLGADEIEVAQKRTDVLGLGVVFESASLLK